MKSSPWILMTITFATIVIRTGADQFPLECQCTCNHKNDPRKSYTASGNLMAKAGHIVPEESHTHYIKVDDSSPDGSTVTLHPTTTIPLVPIKQPEVTTTVNVQNGYSTDLTTPSVQVEVNTISDISEHNIKIKEQSKLTPKPPDNVVPNSSISPPSTPPEEKSVAAKIRSTVEPTTKQPVTPTSKTPFPTKPSSFNAVKTTTSAPVVRPIKPTRNIISIKKHTPLFSFKKNKNKPIRRFPLARKTKIIPPPTKESAVPVVSAFPTTQGQKEEITPKPVRINGNTARRNSFLKQRSSIKHEEKRKPVPMRKHTEKVIAHGVNLSSKQGHKKTQVNIKSEVNTVRKNNDAMAKPLRSNSFRRKHILSSQSDTHRLETIMPKVTSIRISPTPSEKRIQANIKPKTKPVQGRIIPGNSIRHIPTRNRPVSVSNPKSRDIQMSPFSIRDRPAAAKPPFPPPTVQPIRKTTAPKQAKSSIDLLSSLVSSLKTQGGTESVALLLRNLMNADSQSSMDKMIHQLKHTLDQTNQPNQRNPTNNAVMNRQNPTNAAMTGVMGFPSSMLLGNWNVPEQTHPSERQWTTPQPTTTADWRFTMPMNGWNIWPEMNTKRPSVDTVPTSPAWKQSSHPASSNTNDEVKTNLSQTKKSPENSQSSSNTQSAVQTNTNVKNSTQESLSQTSTTDQLLSLLQKLTSGGGGQTGSGQMQQTVDNNMQITDAPSPGFGFPGIPFGMAGMGWDNPFM